MRREKWKQLYETYHKPLYLYALSLAGNRQDAEDLLHTTFVKAYLSYREGGSVRAWLVTVLRNEFYNTQRSRKREVTTPPEQMQDTWRQDTAAQMIARETRQELFAAIQQLPIVMREVLLESTYLQLTDEEIGALHGLRRENVRKIRSRARQRLLNTIRRTDDEQVE